MAMTMYDLAGAEPDRRFSPYCWRTKLSLKHKGLDFETIPWRFTEKSVLAPYNSERVPVIVDSGRGGADSWTIANYLEDTYQDRPPLFANEQRRSHRRLQHPQSHGTQCVAD